MYVIRRMNDSTNIYFISDNENNESNTDSTDNYKFITLNDFSKLYRPYKTADLLILDDDPIIRRLFIENISKYKVKEMNRIQVEK